MYKPSLTSSSLNPSKQIIVTFHERGAEVLLPPVSSIPEEHSFDFELIGFLLEEKSERRFCYADYLPFLEAQKYLLGALLRAATGQLTQQEMEQVKKSYEVLTEERFSYIYGNAKLFDAEKNKSKIETFISKVEAWSHK